ncbi:hypothetical protein MG293_012834 [Ovis ammon polii]|uniref:Uncharacterized protein n=1 Tax=Ovis ammon polii TaxID=230172 RepID=A0AAD4U047_OVIAM|nr:hypothetical protein MG293_012834 [Ovis ammon polii]
MLLQVHRVRLAKRSNLFLREGRLRTSQFASVYARWRKTGTDGEIQSQRFLASKATKHLGLSGRKRYHRGNSKVRSGRPQDGGFFTPQFCDVSALLVGWSMVSGIMSSTLAGSESLTHNYLAMGFSLKKII